MASRRGRLLPPAVPAAPGKAMPSLALQRGRDAWSPGRDGTAGQTDSRRSYAPRLLTFYTNTTTSEKVFAGAGGTWLKPDDNRPCVSRRTALSTVPG